MSTDIIDIAEYFLTKVDREAGDEITHLKLQKICYYAQAWYLAFEGERLFDGYFEAWAHGPVNRELWEEYRVHSYDPIHYPESFDIEGLSSKEREYLDEVWNAYGKYTAKHLEKLTHQETPWIEARGGLPEGHRCETIISEQTMAEYYRGLAEDDEE